MCRIKSTVILLIKWIKQNGSESKITIFDSPPFFYFSHTKKLGKIPNLTFTFEIWVVNYLPLYYYISTRKSVFYISF